MASGEKSFFFLLKSDWKMTLFSAGSRLSGGSVGAFVFPKRHFSVRGGCSSDIKEIFKRHFPPCQSKSTQWSLLQWPLARRQLTVSTWTRWTARRSRHLGFWTRTSRTTPIRCSGSRRGPAWGSTRPRAVCACWASGGVVSDWSSHFLCFQRRFPNSSSNLH